MILCACAEERETESEEGEGKKKILDSPPVRDTDTGDTVNDFKVQSENIIQYSHEMQRTIKLYEISLALVSLIEKIDHGLINHDVVFLFKDGRPGCSILRLFRQSIQRVFDILASDGI